MPEGVQDSGMMQLDLFGDQPVAVSAQAPLLVGPPRRAAVAAQVQAAAAAGIPRVAREHPEGEVMPAQLPEGWKLVADGFNGLVLRTPPEFERPRGGIPRFPYGPEKGSLEAAIRAAEAGVRKLVNGIPWSACIEVEPHYMIERERIEKFAAAWARNGWGKVPRGGNRYVLEYLCKPGVIDQLPNELRPPEAALERVQQAAIEAKQAELEAEAEAEENGDENDE
jgi:hypothetical protein